MGPDLTQRSGHFHGGASSIPWPSIAVSPSSFVSMIALQPFDSFNAEIMRAACETTQTCARFDAQRTY